jgi:hypothetical protein
MDYQGILGQVISKVHSNTAMTPKEYSGIPPLIKLEMAINMHFQSLDEAHKQFASAVKSFGEKYAANISTSFASEPTETKKKICEEYLRLFDAVDSEISKLQKQLASMAKA